MNCSLRILAATVLTVGAVAALSVGPAAEQSDSSIPPEAARVLADIKKIDKEMFSVSEEDGRFLRVLIGARSAKHVLEIGAARGYSAIWMGLALRDTGGSLVTIEFDPARAKEAKANVERAGLSSTVRVVAGDAFAEIPKVAGTFDLVFSTRGSPITRSSSTSCFRGSMRAASSSRTTSSTSAMK